MKERPILFSGPMVRALLDGRKTQTRRVVKPFAKWAERFPICDPSGMVAGHQIWWWDAEHDRVGVSQDCPYGVPGDRLWVRETWSFIGQRGIFELHQAAPNTCKPIYRADGVDADRWIPSIHMPRWASRILREITEVRVERLNDISEADAIAEGVRVLPLQDPDDPSAWWEVEAGTHQARTPVESYRLLWETINGPGSWAENPWVWVMGLKPVTP